jgi:hypothetical protein
MLHLCNLFVLHLYIGHQALHWQLSSRLQCAFVCCIALSLFSGDPESRVIDRRMIVELAGGVRGPPSPHCC